MTPWHRRWQRYLADRGAVLEVPWSDGRERHRADAVLPDGRVVEIQSASISADEIAEREAFYGRSMVWLFDARSALWAGRLIVYHQSNEAGRRATFRWKHARKSIACTRSEWRLDLGAGCTLERGWMKVGPPCGGTGILVSRPLMRALEEHEAPGDVAASEDALERCRTATRQRDRWRRARR